MTSTDLEVSCECLRQQLVPLNNLIQHLMRLNGRLYITLQYLHIKMIKKTNPLLNSFVIARY